MSQCEHAGERWGLRIPLDRHQHQWKETNMKHRSVFLWVRLEGNEQAFIIIIINVVIGDCFILSSYLWFVQNCNDLGGVNPQICGWWSKSGCRSLHLAPLCLKQNQPVTVRSTVGLHCRTGPLSFIQFCRRVWRKDINNRHVSWKAEGNPMLPRGQARTSLMDTWGLWIDSVVSAGSGTQAPLWGSSFSFFKKNWGGAASRRKSGIRAHKLTF